jgi:hypothetical protein
MHSTASTQQFIVMMNYEYFKRELWDSLFKLNCLELKNKKTKKCIYLSAANTWYDATYYMYEKSLCIKLFV